MPKTSRRLRLLAGLAALAALAAGLPFPAAQAATAIPTLSVTAQVTTACHIISNNLDFGAYSGAELDTTTTLSAVCSNGTPYNVGLNQGSSTGATVPSRKMTGPSADTLSYALFQDSGRTTNWGDTIGTDTVSGAGDGVVQTLTVYGRVPAAQFVETGAYEDTITVTLTF